MRGGERILDRVLGEVKIAEDRDGVAERRFAVCLDQGGEGGRIPGLCPLDLRSIQ